MHEMIDPPISCKQLRVLVQVLNRLFFFVVIVPYTRTAKFILGTLGPLLSLFSGKSCGMGPSTPTSPKVVSRSILLAWNFAGHFSTPTSKINQNKTG